MIAAARMLSQTGPRAVKHDLRTEGASKTADAKAGAATTRDTTLNGMLERARKYAGGRHDLNGLVDELEPDTVFDAADLGTAFGMECSLAEQEAANDFAPSELLGE